MIDGRTETVAKAIAAVLGDQDWERHIAEAKAAVNAIDNWHQNYIAPNLPYGYVPRKYRNG